MKKKRKWVVITIVVVLVLSVAGWAYSKYRKTKVKEEVVRIEEVKRGELTERVSAPGEIEPKEIVQIRAKVSGRILEMPYDEGYAVTAGDQNANPPIPASLLLQLDSKDLQSQLTLAEASRNAQAVQIEVEKARVEGLKSGLVGCVASLEQAQKDLERKKGLIESHDISTADFDQVKYKTDTLRADYERDKHNLVASERNLAVMGHNLEAADARIEEAKEKLSYTTIRSPINGVVTRVNAKVGEMVMTGTMNNPGTVILEVSDMSQMLVVAQVDEADIGGLAIGQKATVTVQAFPGVEFTGTVSEIALKHRFSDNRTRYYRTEILLDNDANVAKLYTGLTADVDIQTQRHADVIRIPTQAILARDVDSLPLEIRDKSPELDKGKKFTTVVYRYNDGSAKATPVRTGQSDMTHTIILSGLNEGDKVVVGPYKVLDNLKHDQKLKDERQVEAEKKAKESKKEKGKSFFDKATKDKSKKDNNDINEPTGK